MSSSSALTARSSVPAPTTPARPTAPSCRSNNGVEHQEAKQPRLRSLAPLCFHLIPMGSPISNVRPPPDQLLTDLADYALNTAITSDEAYDTARWCLADTLACGILALA